MERLRSSRRVYSRIGLMLLLHYVTLGPVTSDDTPQPEEGQEEAMHIISMLTEDTDKFCVQNVKDSTTVCIFIQAYSASWEAAQQACADWGGRLPEPRFRPQKLRAPGEMDEWLSSFIITQLKQRKGTWLGARAHFTDTAPEPAENQPEGGRQNGRGGGTGGHPDLLGSMSSSAQCEQLKCRCATYSQWDAAVQERRCDCFKPVPFICVTSKNKDLMLCPEGFSQCSSFPMAACYMVGYPALNWFRAKEVCNEMNARLPDPSEASEQAALHCMAKNKPDSSQNYPSYWGSWASDSITWTLDGAVWWSWNSTGEEVVEFQWESNQPQCPLRECLVMETNGAWSTANCDTQRNFMCIKVNSTCEDCILRTYGESRNDIMEDIATQEPSIFPKVFNSAWMMIVAVLGSVVVVIIIALLAIIIALKRTNQNRAHDHAAEIAHLGSFYEHLTVRNNSIYENDVPGFEAYTNLGHISPYATIELDNYCTPISEPTTSTTTTTPAMLTTTIPASVIHEEEEVIPTQYKLRSSVCRQSGDSLPATPDLIPMRLRTLEQKQCGNQHNNDADDNYLVLLSAPYERPASPARNQRSDCSQDGADRETAAAVSESAREPALGLENNVCSKIHSGNSDNEYGASRSDD